MKIQFDFELNPDDINNLYEQFSEIETQEDHVVVYTDNLQVEFEEFISPWLDAGFSLSYKDGVYVIWYIDLI